MVIAPDPSRRRAGSPSSSDQNAGTRASASPISAPSAAANLPGSSGCVSWPRATAPSCCGPGWPRSSTTPSAAPRRAGRSRRRGARPRTCSSADGDLILESGPSPRAIELRLDSRDRGSVEGDLKCPLSVTRRPPLRRAGRLRPRWPASAGAWRPVEIRAPEGCLLNARPPAAVAAGNVETSSRVADLVLEALGGPRRAGAGPGHDEQPDPRGRAGPTTRRSAAARVLPRRRRAQRGPRRDVEHAEHADRGALIEYPLRVARAGGCAAARGGSGRHPGGDGIVVSSRRWRRCATRLDFVRAALGTPHDGKSC